jgi:hypothetical protein
VSSKLADWIREFANELVTEAPSARTAAGRVGGIVDNPGHGLPLIVRAESPDLDSATAANRADTEVLSHVSLQLAESTSLTVGDLSGEFGAFSRPPSLHPGSPARIIFRRIAEGEAGSVTLSVEVEPKQDFEASRVVGITLRFDEAD